MAIFFLVMGVLFGFVLSRSGAADYDFIQGMFLFTNLQLYGIIGTAVVLTAPGLWWITRRGRSLDGSPIAFEIKQFNRGTVVGSVRAGWCIIATTLRYCRWTARDRSRRPLEVGSR